MAEAAQPRCVQSFLHDWNSAYVSLKLIADGRISIDDAAPHNGWLYDELNATLVLLLPMDDGAGQTHVHQYDRFNKTNVWQLHSVDGREVFEPSFLFPKESTPLQDNASLSQKKSSAATSCLLRRKSSQYQNRTSLPQKQRRRFPSANSVIGANPRHAAAIHRHRKFRAGRKTIARSACTQP